LAKATPPGIQKSTMSLISKGFKDEKI